MESGTAFKRFSGTAVLGSEVLHVRSLKPCSSPLQVFSKGKTIQLLYSPAAFELRILIDLLNTGKPCAKKSVCQGSLVHNYPGRYFDPVLPMYI